MDIKIVGNVEKGYLEDAGVDIFIDEDVTFEPLSTTIVPLNCKVIIPHDCLGTLCARTSAAAKGLNIAMCPIDPDYDGKLMAIVHNISNKQVKYSKGQSFCQVMVMKAVIIKGVPVRHNGVRKDERLGSTGRCD